MPRPDLTVLAIPAFVGAMGAELPLAAAHPAPPGTTRAGDYELADTIASLTMGVGSLIAPFVTKRLLDPVTPGVGRSAKVLMGVAVAASASPPSPTSCGAAAPRAACPRPAPSRAGRTPERRAPGPDAVPHLRNAPLVPPRHGCHGGGRRDVDGAHGGDDVVGADERHPAVRAAAGGTWHRHRSRTPSAILGWDAIYYWNHRLNHESRWLWAMHVVHH